MADIEIAPLSDRLGDEEIAEVDKALKKMGAPRVPVAEDVAPTTIAAGIDADVLAEFLDHLEANDIACDVYVPVEFDGRVEAADLRIGSVPALIDVLDELREDLSIDEEEDEEDEGDEEEYEIGLVDKQMREVWKYFYDAAQAALERHLSVFVTGD